MPWWNALPDTQDVVVLDFEMIQYRVVPSFGLNQQTTSWTNDSFIMTTYITYPDECGVDDKSFISKRDKMLFVSWL